MNVELGKLESKKEVDNAIRSTEDKVLVLRFGRENDQECMRLDNIVSVLLRLLPIQNNLTRKACILSKECFG